MPTPAISVSISTDPFTEVISNLTSLTPKLSSLSVPLTSIANTIDAVDTIINDVNNLFTGVDDACSAITDVQELAEALSAIPVVDAIAGPAAEFLSDVSVVASDLKNTLSPFQTDVQEVKNLLDDARNGIDKLNSAVTTAAADLPNFLNTISIIDCLMEIATPLTSVMTTLDVNSKLSSLVDTYNDIKNDLSLALDPLTTLINDVLTLLNEVVHIFGEIIQTLGGSLDTAINNIAKVRNVLDPIKDAFDKVEDAIAPVKWAMDAVSCVVDAVFKPVINAILDATGLSSLLDMMENKLKSFLDISSLENDLQNYVGADIITKLGFLSVNSPTNYIQQFSAGWTKMEDGLGKYSPSKNANSKTAIVDLMNAISNGAIDPNSPSIIPNWPNAPNFNIAANPAFMRISSVQISPKVAHINNMNFISLPRVASASSNTMVFTNPAVQQLSDASQPVIAKLESILPAVTDLFTTLETFNKTLVLPQRFSTEVDIYNQYISASQKLLTFLSSFNQVAGIVQPLISIANNQADECSKLMPAISSLQTSISSMNSAVLSIQSHLPTSSLINSAITNIESWPGNAQTLLQAISSNKIQPNKDQALQFQTYTAKITDACNGLQGQLTAIGNTTDIILTSIGGVSTEIKSFLTSIASISSNGNLLPVGGIDKAAKLANILNQISSILDPISTLLNMEGCKVDADNKIKSGAKNALDIILQAGNDFVTKNNLGNAANSLLNELANDILPTGKLYNLLSSATVSINQTSVAEINTQAGNLASALDALNKSLLNAKSYTVNNNGKSTVANTQYINQDLSTQIITLSGQMAHT